MKAFYILQNDLEVRRMANGEEPEAPKDWTDLLKGWASTAAATLVSAIVSVGFVAFAGKAVLWTRFSALQVPPDQVVKAVPQSEAVAIGASILFIFGFFGAIAAVALYLVDRGARATLGMGRALVGRMMLEGIAAVILTNEVSDRKKVTIGLALLSILVFAAAAFAITFMRRFVTLKDALRARPSETLEPERSASLLGDGAGKLRVSFPKLLLLGAPPLGALGFLAALLFIDQSTWLVVAMVAQIIALGVAELFIVHDLEVELHKSIEFERLQKQAQKEDAEKSTSGIRLPTKRDRENQRVGKRRPYRFSLSFRGAFVMAALALSAVALPALILQEWWFAVSIGTAVILGFGLWRIACLTKPGFIWFGFAAFLSVPLFGTLSLMARNVGHPEAQPMALIRKTDGPDESIQGLYVTETNDRVYFANIATEGCEDHVKRHSGRLLWVPSDEVVAMSIGPLQSVDEASTSALEMAYELTPAVETPTAGAVSLTVPERRSKAIEEAEGKRQAKEVEEHAPGLDQRLQSPGPAVRPNFGAGLRLEPEVASPGAEVELQLTKPDRNVHGFGSRPEDRLLRLNGVPVTVKRERTLQAYDAEYVETVGGQVLTLDGKGVYRRRDHKPELLSQGEQYKGPRYVKLSDNLVKEVTTSKPNGLASGYSGFLPIHGQGDRAVLDKEEYEPKVTLVGSTTSVSLKKGFKRQKWHEGAIAFEVPRHAKSGVVTVDCGQLAGSPLLRVATPPVARIEAQMRGGSKRVVLDARRSRDASGKQLTERWNLGKRSLGRHKRVALTLQPRMRPYRVRLTVTDPDGASNSAELLLLRLPESFFEFGKATLAQKKKQIERLRRAHAGLETFVRRHPPSSIELDGNADDVGSAPFNMTLSLERAEQVRRKLLRSRAHPATGAIPVSLRAFGETCPIVRAPGRQPANRRVDIFVLEPGDKIIEPKGCRAGKEEHTTW